MPSPGIQPFIVSSWQNDAGAWGLTIPGYAKQFEPVSGNIKVYSSVASNAVTYVNTTCRITGTTSPNTVINGPSVTFNEPVYSESTGMVSMYVYEYIVSGKYCEDLAVNDVYKAYSNKTKQTFTYTDFNEFVDDLDLFGTPEEKFDKIISYEPDDVAEVTVDYNFIVEGSNLSVSQRVHLVPTRYFRVLQTWLNSIHDNRNQDQYAFLSESFNGDGIEKDFMLSEIPAGGVDIFVDGITTTTGFTLTGNTISFTVAPYGTITAFPKNAANVKITISSANTDNPAYSTNSGDNKNWISPENC